MFEGLIGTFLNTVGLIFILVVSLYFLEKGQVSEASLGITAGVLFLLFLNLDKISSFKGGGFELEMNNVVLEAKNSIEDLREVSVPLIEIGLEFLAKEGRIASPMNHDEKMELYTKLIAIKDNVEQGEGQLNEKISTLLNLQLSDMIRMLLSDLEGRGVIDSSQEIHKKVWDENRVPDITILLSFISKLDLSSSEKELLKKIKKFEMTHDLAGN